MAYCALLLTRGPGPLLQFYGAIPGTYFGMDELGWEIVGITAFAALFAGCRTLLVLVADLHRPEQRAIADARRAVENYCGTAPGASGAGSASVAGRPRGLLAGAYGAVNRAWLTLNSAQPATTGRGHRNLERELLTVNRDLAVSVLENSRVPGHVPQVSPDTPLLLGRPSLSFLLAQTLLPELLLGQCARVETAIAAVERFTVDGTADTDAGRRARVELSYELTHHHSVLDRAAAEDPRLTSLKKIDDSLIDNGYTALAKAWV